MRFFDASALVKRYIQERDSARIRRLLAAGDVAVSRLSEIEVVSALARVAREGGVSSVQRDRAMAAFLHDLSTWTIVEVTGDVARSARELLLRYPLPSGDAIQLGSALSLREALGELDRFVAYDTRLVEAASAEGLHV